MSRDLIDHIIEDWEGVLDEKGEALPCTRESKIKLVEGGYPLLGGKLVQVSRWVMAKYEQYDEKRKEKKVKNSKPSQDG